MVDFSRGVGSRLEILWVAARQISICQFLTETDSTHRRCNICRPFLLAIPMGITIGLLKLTAEWQWLRDLFYGFKFLWNLRIPTMLFLAPTSFGLAIWLIQTTNQDVKRYDNDFMIVLHTFLVALAASDVWFLRGDVSEAQRLLDQAPLEREARDLAHAEEASKYNMMSFVIMVRNLPSVAYFHRISGCTVWISTVAITFASVDIECECTGEDMHGTFILLRTITLVAGVWAILVILYREFYRTKQAKVFKEVGPPNEILIESITGTDVVDVRLVDIWAEYPALDWFAVNTQFVRFTNRELRRLCETKPL